MSDNEPDPLDEFDRRIIAATQNGLPLVPDPFEVVAQQTGLTAVDVRLRMQTMLESGVIRRIGAVPNHYALGLSANGMSVWDVDDVDVRMGCRRRRSGSVG